MNFQTLEEEGIIGTEHLLAQLIFFHAAKLTIAQNFAKLKNARLLYQENVVIIFLPLFL